MATTGTSRPFPLAGLGQAKGLTQQNLTLSQAQAAMQQAAANPYNNNLYSGYGAAQPSTPAIGNCPRRLTIFTTKEQLEESLLGDWIGGDKKLFWEGASTAECYDEIIVLPYKYEEFNRFGLNKKQKRELFEFMLENLTNSLREGGRIINLNDVEEGEDESQGLSEQADAGKPDVGGQCNGADAPVLPVQREAGGSD